MKVDGRQRYGPQRETRAGAQADLDRARQCESRHEMEQCLRKLIEKERPANDAVPMDANAGGTHSVEEIKIRTEQKEKEKKKKKKKKKEEKKKKKKKKKEEKKKTKKEKKEKQKKNRVKKYEKKSCHCPARNDSVIQFSTSDDSIWWPDASSSSD